MLFWPFTMIYVYKGIISIPDVVSQKKKKSTSVIELEPS